uniref:Uncharacterized protein n=1 Tax=Anguilla anguilla TaxID=7936 RepID=A0A0E9Q7K6_ANGAN
MRSTVSKAAVSSDRIRTEEMEDAVTHLVHGV